MDAEENEKPHRMKLSGFGVGIKKFGLDLFTPVAKGVLVLDRKIVLPMSR